MEFFEINFEYKYLQIFCISTNIKNTNCVGSELRKVKR